MGLEEGKRRHTESIRDVRFEMNTEIEYISEIGNAVTKKSNMAASAILIL